MFVAKTAAGTLVNDENLYRRTYDGKVLSSQVYASIGSIKFVTECRLLTLELYVNEFIYPVRIKAFVITMVEGKTGRKADAIISSHFSDVRKVVDKYREYSRVGLKFGVEDFRTFLEIEDLIKYEKINNLAIKYLENISNVYNSLNHKDIIE